MQVPAVFPIEGVARDYAWGSTSVIQDLLGLPHDGRPLAELWLGAHPDDPATALDTTLDKLIAADPVGLLGAETAEAYDGRLPFLLKVLAAASPLSIQLHPTLEQARAGFAAEDAAGIPRGAPERNYRDPNHKPELLCALTPFEALCGFRPVEQTLEVLRAFDLPALEPVAAMLSCDEPLRAAFTYLLTLPDPSPLAHAVAVRAAELERVDTGGATRAVTLAAAEFPGDVGVPLSLLLNYVGLQPGEAIYLGAGNVHAYLRGTGIEIMANSDNVLRCGLTPKHIDVPELLKITDFSPLDDPRWPNTGDNFVVPVPDFALGRYEVTGPLEVDVRRPSIALCVAGEVHIGGVVLNPGRAAFVTAMAGPVPIGGSGVVFVATPG